MVHHVFAAVLRVADQARRLAGSTTKSSSSNGIWPISTGQSSVQFRNLDHAVAILDRQP